jgi:UDP-galactopyranose mutase
MFENLLLQSPESIHVRVNVDYFAAKEANALPKHKLLVFTGPVDSFYAQQGMPKLEYRSLRFENEFVKDPGTWCDVMIGGWLSWWP